MACPEYLSPCQVDGCMSAPAAGISVYVNGDGTGSWQCFDTPLYRVPTRLFDYYMLVGALSTTEDLQRVVEQGRAEGLAADEEYTSVYVAQDGSWSGSPSNLFVIPSDVFCYLQNQHHPRDPNNERTIGRLETPADLESLVERVRNEMLNGIVMFAEREILPRSRPLNVEEKLCGHCCTVSSVKTGCCACLDARPVQEEGTYPAYLDGRGWVDDAKRDAMYCPLCTALDA